MIANSDGVNQRLKKDTLSQDLTVEKFIEKIQDQCNEVLVRHEGYSVEAFQKPEIYRMCEREMMEVKVS
jgi:hypothetical protein